MNKKQVMDIRPNSDGISQAESNEQQRNWSEDFLRRSQMTRWQIMTRHEHT